MYHHIRCIYIGLARTVYGISAYVYVHRADSINRIWENSTYSELFFRGVIL